MKPEQDDPAKQTNILIPKSTRDILDYLKERGFSHSDILLLGAKTVLNCFLNKAEWAPTKEATTRYELTKAFRESRRQEGAKPEELAELDKKISLYRDDLKHLEKEGKLP